MTIKFGSAGNPASFYEQGYKSSWQMPAFLAEMGLSAYEYQCSRGNRISQESAEKIAKQAILHNISLSVHAPYYINLASKDSDSIIKSKNYLLGSLQVAKWLGATKVVFHAGGVAKIPRQEGLNNALRALAAILEEASKQSLDNIILCPETMGKKNQLGTLDEVIELCLLDKKRIKPALDFGHLHALAGGTLNCKDDFACIIEQLENKLGSQIVQNFHAHFSPIEFTKAGEKKHWNLSYPEFGPEFAHLAEVIVEKDLTPTIICESADRQAEDARTFADIYQKFLEIKRRKEIID